MTTQSRKSNLPVVYLAATLVVRLVSEWLVWSIEASHYYGFEFLRMAGLVLVPLFILQALRQKTLATHVIAGVAIAQIVIVLGLPYVAEIILALFLFVAVMLGASVGS